MVFQDETAAVSPSSEYGAGFELFHGDEVNAGGDVDVAVAGSDFLEEVIQPLCGGTCVQCVGEAFGEVGELGPEGFWGESVGEWVKVSVPCGEGGNHEHPVFAVDVSAGWCEGVYVGFCEGEGFVLEDDVDYAGKDGDGESCEDQGDNEYAKEDSVSDF